MEGRGLQDAASKASHAICLKDLVGSFNAKSALTVGDLCRGCFRSDNPRVTSALDLMSVQALRLMALILMPLILSLMACL